MLFLLVTNCQTIQQKTDTIVKKENQKLSKFIGKPISNVISVLGEPKYHEKNEQDNTLYVYETKKYGIICQRKFEVNKTKLVIGFFSKGCL